MRWFLCAGVVAVIGIVIAIPACQSDDCRETATCAASGSSSGASSGGGSSPYLGNYTCLITFDKGGTTTMSNGTSVTSCSMHIIEKDAPGSSFGLMGTGTLSADCTKQ
jgi:hypothetical protein